MNRRTFIKTLSVGAMWAGFGGVAEGAARFAGAVDRKKRQNIVFVLTDDMGWGDLDCYGNTNVQTPNIDQLAAEGIKFNQFYANSPVCSPTRVGIMTGNFPSRLGVHTIISDIATDIEQDVPHYLDPSFPTITSVFQKAGYRTGHFGKWHLGVPYPGEVYVPTPDKYGIDDYRIPYGKDCVVWEGWDRDTHRPYSNELFFDEGIRFIEENKDRPFFLQLWTLDPHLPLLPTAEMREPYLSFPEPQQTYYSVLTDLDKHIGRFLTRLDELGLSEDTIIIFTSDNGPEIHGTTNYGSPGPFRGMKRSLYEGGIREPFIIRWKGSIKGGQVNDDSVIAGSDMIVSLSKIAGITLPQNVNIDGEDMSGALMGQPQMRTKRIMWEYRAEVYGDDPSIISPILAVRDGKWKFFWNPDDSRSELYDILADPTETANQASQYPQVVSELRDVLLQWHSSMPERWKHSNAGIVS